MSGGTITLYIATSLDGYIADESGSVEWLQKFEDPTANSVVGEGWVEFFESTDCLVVGATTYEQIFTFGEWPYGDKPTYVLTHRELPRPTDAIEFYEGDVDALAKTLRDEYEDIWLVGGGDIAQQFLDAHLIDEFRLSLIPIILGNGTSLFPAKGHHWLELRSVKPDDTGIVELHYQFDE